MANNNVLGIIGSADGPTAILVSNANATTAPEATTESIEVEYTCPCATCEICLGTEATTTVADEDMFSNIKVEPKNFVENLGHMGTGMVGIFVVIGVIIAATALMNKIFSGKK